MFFKKIRRTISLIRARFQGEQDSYLRHNKQYEQDFVNNTLDRHLGFAIKENYINNAHLKLGKLLKAHPKVRYLAVDVGSGCGWLSAKLSKIFRKVVAIEPSAAAIKIAKHHYPPNKYPNIEWRQGFAEKTLNSLKITKPCLFVTGAVLSHLTDGVVINILKKINELPPKGSLLAFAEGWGKEQHQYMWHIRTKAWWQAQLSNWSLNFHGPSVENTPERHMGIHGVKIN